MHITPNTKISICFLGIFFVCVWSWQSWMEMRYCFITGDLISLAHKCLSIISCAGCFSLNLLQNYIWGSCDWVFLPRLKATSRLDAFTMSLSNLCCKCGSEACDVCFREPAGAWPLQSGVSAGPARLHVLRGEGSHPGWRHNKGSSRCGVEMVFTGPIPSETLRGSSSKRSSDTGRVWY